MNGTYEVELTVEQGEHKLVNGFIARADLYPSQTKPSYLIPFQALTEAEGEHAFVFQPLPDNTARRLPVVIDYLLDDKAVIAQGLVGIPSIITEGAAYLTDGSIIQIIENE